MASPIADLSYRGYQGNLREPGSQWQVIARMGIKQAFRKRAYWVFTALAGWYYVVMVVIVFFVQQATAAAERMAPPGAMGEGRRSAIEAFLGRLEWRDQFIHGFSFGHLFWLSMALLLAAGAIANDNKANALLVYLSKPVTRRDYLLGKFVGIWVPLTLAMLLPAAVFYIYGAANYRDFGFISSDPWLPLKMLWLCASASAFHTAIALGISALFRQGGLAGAAYATVYFLGTMFRTLMGVLWMIGHEERNQIPVALVGKLWSFTLDGMLLGLAKSVLQTRGTFPFGAPRDMDIPAIPPPPQPLHGLLMLAIGLLFLGVAWSRIRAVEVVK